MRSARSTFITGAFAAGALTLSACGGQGTGGSESDQAAPPSAADGPEQGC